MLLYCYWAGVYDDKVTYQTRNNTFTSANKR